MSQDLMIALTKGRVLVDELAILAKAGVEPLEDPTASRRLVFDTNQDRVKIMILRGMDVATYVDHGIADVGMSGKDVLLEYPGTGYYEPLDLGLGRCALMVAGLVDESELPSRLRIATKFTNTAKRYYAERGVQVDIIKLYGAMELAPVTGLAHRIVDIVETGNTLKANGLRSIELITQITTRLIVNTSSYKTKFDQVRKLIDSLEAVL
ncbi:MAG: ATP phosphoribosyltransferase [Gammaproteobacteria bacterium]|nr:ATP phosphoribosyltransferase [Gammaproteobacteria bacterium]